MTQLKYVSDHNQSDPSLLITVSIVTFKPDIAELSATLESLVQALSRFDPSSFAITIVDNSPEDTVSELLQLKLRNLNHTVIQGHGNVGFGCGHNRAIQRTGRYHLILNPDIKMEADSLKLAVNFMQENPSCALLSPYASWPDGHRQYLCKRFPAMIDLLIRGFAPALIRNLFQKRLSNYEMRSETQSSVFWGPPIVSGCFMFFRSETLHNLGGFDPSYFLYFEDFDLSIRCGKVAPIAYVPTVKVIHTGGHASRKGIWHIRRFIESAIRFYSTYGLKLL